MIAVTEAIKIIEQNTEKGKVISKALSKAFGLVVAEDLLSPIDMPPFNQSSMDGYAMKYSDSQVYNVIGEMQAGSSENINLSEGEAVRIFTGARVPDDADTVVMQEHVSKVNNRLTFTVAPKPFSNVRPKGEQIRVGDVALKKGTVLHEAAIGFLVGLGFQDVKVFVPPKVSILITGNELRQPGEKLKEGQVYDSNSVTLRMALKRIGIRKIRVEQVKDDLKSTVKSIKKHLKKSDIVLISGGISVGDYDFVEQALVANKVSELFYKVNQKPGKPLWFGKKGKKRVFALPGNPASSLTCYYVYVLPTLRKYLGYRNIHLPREKATSDSDIYNRHKKDLFLKGMVINGKAQVLTGQASSMLKSYAICNALILVPSNTEIIETGNEIEYIKLNDTLE